MQKSNQIVPLSQRMIKGLEDNWLSELELLNLHTIFRPIYKQNLTILNQNAQVAFVILAYSEDSPWLNPRKDRNQNKIEIITGIGVDPENRIYREVLHYENEAVQQATLSYLLFHVDARFQEVMSLLEYANKNILFCNNKTFDKQKVGTQKGEEGNIEDVYEYLDQIEIAKVNKEKGDLLFKALEARSKAESLLKALENDFQKTDHATTNDFGFQFSDVKSYDPMKWEHRLRARRSKID